MSEANILNPSAASELNPTFGYDEGRPLGVTLEQAASGRMYSKPRVARGRVFDLHWMDVSKATMHLLRQWAEQYETSFFSLADWERSRYFSGRFDPAASEKGPLQISPAGNERWNVRARFLEEPTRALYAYYGAGGASEWTRDARFIEDRDDDGVAIPTFTGTWNTETDANDHGGTAYNSNVTGDTAEWLYFGYGFRYWSKKQGNLGEAELSATRLRDGATVLATQVIDLYDATGLAAAALYTKSDLPLDWYKAQLRVKGTKNASSTGFYIIADAIEVMR